MSLNLDAAQREPATASFCACAQYLTMVHVVT
eukprot:COSAG06_NODE_454_length_15536_cov_23.174257_4_plen_32_part_00